MTEPGTSAIAEHLVRNLRIAQSLIVFVILGFALTNLLAALDRYAPPLVGFAWFAALLGVAVADALLVVRHRSWGVARWPVAAAVLMVSWLATAALPAADLVTPAHVTLGVVGWFGVLLFSDLGLSWVVGFLVAHVGLTAIQLGLAGRADTDILVALALVTVSIGGFQLAVAAAGRALDAVGQAAATAAVRQVAMRTAEAVARHVHADRESRYARLKVTALPLLHGLADMSLPPSDPEVQRRAALEAARMRRLFAEGGDVVDPLAAGLGALIDVVERRGVLVRYSVRGAWAIPPPNVLQTLLDEVGAALLSAVAAARVTLSGVDGQVVVSVVADRVTAHPGVRELEGGVRTTTVVDGPRTWVEARWTSDSLQRS